MRAWSLRSVPASEAVLPLSPPSNAVLLSRTVTSGGPARFGLPGRVLAALLSKALERPGGPPMAHYLIEVGYTADAWSAQIDTEANVIDRITPALKSCGAKLECMYYAFGETDLVGVI